MRNKRFMINGPRVPRSQMKVTTFLADEEMGLFDFILKKLDGISRNKVKGLLSHEMVKVDGNVEKQYNFAVKPGMVIEVTKNPRFMPMKNFDRFFAVLYEDEHLIVVDKADGVLSMGVGRGSLNMKILLDQYFAYTKQHCTAHVVHRLDTRTSGVMVYAKSVEVQQLLVHNWHAHVRDRRYVAVVEGAMESDHGHIESWLRDTPSRKVVSSPFNNGGKWASTDWWLLDSNDDFSLIELHLNTGRKNQIRVHMEVLGHPIVGDYKYGSIEDSLGRLGLHAFRLAFVHPITGEELEFETPFPTCFLDLFPEPMI